MTLTDTVPFSRSDVQLVQSILQTPDALITGVALDGFHSRSAEALKVSGVLQPDGHQLAAVSLSDHDDEAVTLTWSPEEGGYGYFNPEKGWVSVPSPSLQTYAVDMKAVLGRLVWGGQAGTIRRNYPFDAIRQNLLVLQDEFMM